MTRRASTYGVGNPLIRDAADAGLTRGYAAATTPMRFTCAVCGKSREMLGRKELADGGYACPHCVAKGGVRLPSKERGCNGKANLGREYVKQADRLAAKHGKQYGVYLCPHCGGAHLTTKLHKAGEYPELVHVTAEVAQ